MTELRAMFEQLEPGSAARLDEFLRQAAYKYEVGINKFVHMPGRSLLEFADPRLLVDAWCAWTCCKACTGTCAASSRPEKLLKLMEFPVLFLGATPENTPALYSLMNYADLALGTWYPKGGMHKIVEGMVQLAQEQGVKLEYNQEVQEICGRKRPQPPACRRPPGFAPPTSWWPAPTTTTSSSSYWPPSTGTTTKSIGIRAPWRPRRCCFTWA